MSCLRALDVMLRPVRSHRRLYTGETHGLTCTFKVTLAVLWETAGEMLGSTEELPASHQLTDESGFNRMGAVEIEGRGRYEKHLGSKSTRCGGGWLACGET